jgi:hypothetical protein
MKRELQLLERISKVEVPSYLIQDTNKKINELELTKHRHFNWIAAASVIAILINVGFVFQYYTSSKANYNETNPYEYATSYYMNYE